MFVSCLMDYHPFLSTNYSAIRQQIVLFHIVNKDHCSNFR